MLIRMKQAGNPAWEEKFDEVSSVVLDHIDILTETANEFSTFAKLYSEDATQIDLDALIREEVSMFDNKDVIEFSYLGLEGARIMGPKPQLTRVIVNLVANAVQAVESRMQEESDRGVEPERGKIWVQLRNSTQDGFYDIVVEDNGPGVSAENQPKLFTPNFTTKSSGTGLGLAISRSILERCGATISYSTSFSLGGACFTVRYPR
jgi:signal transduction histidine kinase